MTFSSSFGKSNGVDTGEIFVVKKTGRKENQHPLLCAGNDIELSVLRYASSLTDTRVRKKGNDLIKTVQITSTNESFSSLSVIHRRIAEVDKIISPTLTRPAACLILSRHYRHLYPFPLPGSASLTSVLYL